MQYFCVVTALLLACFGAYAKNDANLRIQQSKKGHLLSNEEIRVKFDNFHAKAKNMPVNLEQGKKEWKKQQNNVKHVQGIERHGGTIFNEDGTPSISYVSAAITLPNTWFFEAYYASDSNCTANTDDMLSFYFEGAGCYVAGTYNHTTQEYSETGSTEYEIDVTDPTVLIVSYYSYSSSTDCTGVASNSNVGFINNAIGCDGSTYYGYDDTTVPLFNDYSPYTKEIPGYGFTNYAMDNSDGDLNYITYYDWDPLDDYTNGEADTYDTCYIDNGVNTTVTCHDNLMSINKYYAGYCDANHLNVTDDYDAEIVDYEDDTVTTGYETFYAQWFYYQVICTGGSFSPTTAPTTTPTTTTAPTAAPTAESDDESSAVCFAGSEMVTLESGLSMPIANVVVGDRVLAANSKGVLSFSDVIAVPHAKNSDRVMFNEISLVNGASVRMTGEHLLPVAASCGADAVFSITAAKNVVINSCVMTVNGQSVVVGNDKVAGAGIYTIVTNEEYVVVNGIVASPFAASHVVGNTFYNVYRAMYNYVPGLFKSSLFHTFYSTFAHLVMKTW